MTKISQKTGWCFQTLGKLRVEALENTGNFKKKITVTPHYSISEDEIPSGSRLQQFFAKLEGRDSIYLALIRYPRRLQDLVHLDTSTMDNKEIPLVRVEPGCSRQRSRILFDFEGNRTLTYARQPFLLTVFYNQGTEQDSTDFGL